MARRKTREMTFEAYNEWSDARQDVATVMAASAEEGGPRVTLVPDPVSMPPNTCPDEVDSPCAPDPAGASPASSLVPSPSLAVTFEAEPSRKVAGWSAMRQCIFIETLAETGSVHVAAQAAGLSARGSYALRLRSPAFAAAWDAAQQLAVGRLSALAFDRAIHGRVEQVYHDGVLVGEKRVPSERLLMWLLARLDPKRFAAPWERRKDDNADPQADAHAAFPALLGALADTPGFAAALAAILRPADDPDQLHGECEHP